MNNMLSRLIPDLFSMAIILPAFLVALTVHEFSHALAATLLGDDTAKRRGRLTLNPFSHIDFVGLLCLIFFRIGWAKPVPFNYYNFKYPRLYSVLTALAGPASNFVLAIFALLLMKYFPQGYFSHTVSLVVWEILKLLAYVSVMLGVFNLIPLPPLDGSHILMVTVLRKYPNVIMWFYRYSIFILLFLFFIPQVRMELINLIEYVGLGLQRLVFGF